MFGVIVRNIADLTGLITRFESGGRKDAFLRSFDGDEIAVEWGGWRLGQRVREVKAPQCLEQAQSR